MRENAAIRAQKAAMRQQTRATASSYRFPVILVQFKDKSFLSETPNSDFSRLLNEVGYSDNGGTGSVHDYYLENSMGTFDATFDVFGPYTYSDTFANDDDNYAAKVLWSVISSHSSEINWSNYDNDGDGTVDMVFMYYAGYNQAENQYETLIWPHKWAFSSAGVSTSTLNGKRFSTYACTSELKGIVGSGTMCGIGTCAHEFSHTQGLPDFYDVNYDEYGDGEAGATYHYDIMCSGSYNNDGRTPPYFTAEERIMMGWLDDYTDLPSSGDIQIPSVNTNFAYKMASSNTTGDGEYFVFECRSGTGWDAYVQPGMIVYHVDKSTKYTVYYKTSNTSTSSSSPYNLWSTQYINASGSHPCFYIVPAADQDNLNYGGSETKLPFPGTENIHYYTPKDWSGAKYDLFSDIAFHSDGLYVTMTREQNYPIIFGSVKNSSGEVLKGATVSIYSHNAPSGNNVIIGSSFGMEKISGRILDNLQMSVQTDEEGYYYIDLSEFSNSTVDIEVVAHGYITKYEAIEVGTVMMTKNFVMRGINEKIDYTLKKFDEITEETSIYGLGAGQTCNSYASIHLTEAELSDYVGRKILSLAFAYSTGESGSVSKVYGIVDKGDDRVLTSQVSSPSSSSWNVVDLSSNNLYVEAGKDYHFGYGLLQCTYGYPLLFTEDNPRDGGFNYMFTASSSSVATSSSWNEATGYGNLLIYVVIDDSTEVDYNYINNPGYGSYEVGDAFALKLIEAKGDRKPGSEISWYFDDEPITTSSNADSGVTVPLKYAGLHVVEARFTTMDGKTKVIELEINVN